MAEFGYHTIGASNDNISQNYVWAKATSTPASDGTLTLVSVYCAILTGTPTVAVALYSDSAGAPGTRLAANDTGVVVGASFGWVDVSLSVAVTTGTQYWFCMRAPGPAGTVDYNVKEDTNGSLTEVYFLNNGGNANFPATQTGATAFANERYSVYGTYTPSAGPTLTALIGEPITGSSAL